jgi:D,D-heptose 1,7-bisphosphate phosphatase
MSVTIRQCAILVGGLATRLGKLAASTPKPLLTVGDRPFLAWLMREFLRFGVEEFVLLTGHLSEHVEQTVEQIARMLPRPVRITVSREPLRAGTGGALFHASDKLDERFLLANGDSIFAANLSHLLAQAASDSQEVIARLALRTAADASRYGVAMLDRDRITAFSERPPPGTPGVINAGVYVLKQRILRYLSPECSLERDVLPELAAQAVLRGTIGSGYFIDIGVPDDLARAAVELPKELRRPALILDRDGVLNVDHGYVGSKERFEWMNGAREAIRDATAAGAHVFVVTNQSGVARGLYDEEAVMALHRWIADQVRTIGGTIDDFRFCPFHPEATIEAYRRVSNWRKPAPGMIVDLIRRWELDSARSVLIGDQATDLAAATAAGITGHLLTGGDLATFINERAIGTLWQ